MSTSSMQCSASKVYSTSTLFTSLSTDSALFTTSCCVQGQVLVKNEFIGVNFIDTYFRSGLYPRPSYPSGLGEEGAGTVEAVGPGEGNFKLLGHIQYGVQVKT